MQVAETKLAALPTSLLWQEGWSDNDLTHRDWEWGPGLGVTEFTFKAVFWQVSYFGLIYQIALRDSPK